MTPDELAFAEAWALRQGEQGAAPRAGDEQGRAAWSHEAAWLSRRAMPPPEVRGVPREGGTVPRRLRSEAVARVEAPTTRRRTLRSSRSCGGRSPLYPLILFSQPPVASRSE